MTVFCLIPVHNRLHETREVLKCLEAQDFPDVCTVVVDDGSTDGTAEAIRRSYPEVILLEGDGSLWWSGAMAAGLSYVLARAKEDDYVLFQNNDTRFAPDYVSRLVSVSRGHGDAVVGSILKDMARPEVILSIAPKINYRKVRTEELLGVYEESSLKYGRAIDLPEVIEADALSGRGTLYPTKVFRSVGSIRQRLLPHYLADYEMSARAKAAGFRTLVSTRAVVWTGAETSGVDAGSAGIGRTLFSRRSRYNIIDAIVFFTLCGPWHLRITAPLRVPMFRALRSLARGRMRPAS